MLFDIIRTAYLTQRAYRRGVKTAQKLLRLRLQCSRYETVLTHHLDKITLKNEQLLREQIATLHARLNETTEDMNFNNEFRDVLAQYWVSLNLYITKKVSTNTSLQS
jgi:hypothetical protein